MSSLPAPRSRAITACLGAVALVGTSIIGASAARATEPEMIQEIATAAPEVLHDVSTATNQSDGEPVRVGSMDVTMPSTTADDLTLDTGTGHAVGVTLPTSHRAAPAVQQQPGVVSYDNDDGSSTVPVTKNDGGVQILTVIDSATAPHSFTYGLSLPHGATLHQSDDGAVYAATADDDLVAAIAPAWAKDAKGDSVKTHYDVRDGTVTQVIEPTASATYPIVADPYLGVQMVKKVRWVKRDSRGWTLEVTPTAGSRAFGGAYLAGVYGWKEVQDRAGKQNKQLEWQYICHQQFAFAKATYNLDTWWKRSNYADSVRNKCN